MAYITTAQAHLALITALLANLPTGFTSAKVKLPNRSMISGYENSAWLRPTVIVSDSPINAADGNIERTEGFFVVDVIFPIGDDTASHRATADEIKASFKGQTFDDVKCQSVTIADNPDDYFYIIQVSIDFYFESA